MLCRNFLNCKIVYCFGVLTGLHSLMMKFGISLLLSFVFAFASTQSMAKSFIHEASVSIGALEVVADGEDTPFFGAPDLSQILFCDVFVIPANFGQILYTNIVPKLFSNKSFKYIGHSGLSPPLRS